MTRRSRRIACGATFTGWRQAGSSAHRTTASCLIGVVLYRAPPDGVITETRDAYHYQYVYSSTAPGAPDAFTYRLNNRALRGPRLLQSWTASWPWLRSANSLRCVTLVLLPRGHIRARFSNGRLGDLKHRLIDRRPLLAHSEAHERGGPILRAARVRVKRKREVERSSGGAACGESMLVGMARDLGASEQKKTESGTAATPWHVASHVTYSRSLIPVARTSATRK